MKRLEHEHQPAPLTTREIFSWLYARARAVQKHPRQRDWRAYDLAEDAVEELFHKYGYGPYDIDHVLRVSKAVLWALHWRFMPQIHKTRGAQSERHFSFEASAEGTRTWFSKPRLPA